MRTQDHIDRIENNIKIHEQYLEKHPKDKEAIKRLKILKYTLTHLFDILQK